MLYYLAQSYSTDPEHFYLEAVRDTEALLEMGCVVFSPILHNHHFSQTMIRKGIMIDYLHWDLKLLDHIDHLTLLFAKSAFGPTGQFVSPGAKKEYEYAQARHLPCYYLDAFLFGIARRVEL